MKRFFSVHRVRALRLGSGCARWFADLTEAEAEHSRSRHQNRNQIRFESAVNGYVQIFIVVFFLCTGHISLVFPQSSVWLKIQSEGFQPIRVLVSRFDAAIDTDITGEVRDVLMNDLTLSGFFTVIDEMKLNASFSDTSNSMFRNEINAAAKLSARIGIQQESVVLGVQLADLPGGNVIFAQEFTATLNSIRWLSHEVADKAAFYLVGEDGIAATQIACIRDQRTIKEVVLIDYDGHNNRQVTHSNTINLSPCWAPNGRALAFTSYIKDNPDMVILDLRDNQVLKSSRQKGLNIAPAWSPDGRRIALTLSLDGNAEIYIKEIATGRTVRLTNHPAIDSSPSWAPNGREIAFTSDRSGSPQIYLMDAEGSNLRRLTFQGNYNDSPDWSPRGDRIAYVSRIDGRFQIFTIDINGEDRKQVTDSNGNNENPSWAPDGFHLAFASNRNGTWQIYAANFDGTNLRQITKEGENISPAWSPRLGRKVE